MEMIPKDIYEMSVLEVENMSNTYFVYYEILNKWMNNIMEGKEISEYLKSNNMNNIVIYGIGKIGEILYKNLNNNIKILYTLDSNIDDSKVNQFKMVSLKNIDKSIKVDAVIVTPVYAFQSIKEYLINTYNDSSISIISIDDIILSM